MTEQPTTEQPYTEADVQLVAAALHSVHCLVPHDRADDEDEDHARVALDALAAAWRLLPEGASADVLLSDGSHTYWSTHCRHDNHAMCAATLVQDVEPLAVPHPLGVTDRVRRSVRRKPAQCKTCASPCICPCHAPVHINEESTDGN